MTKKQDPELLAMKRVWKALRGLPPSERTRVVAWVRDRLFAEEQRGRPR